ncbi:hypothetical protein LZZ85_09585 [Terrimonas sp. NA20]|uniref:Uncharacterized protein n=1 Tax=Terrimonas ginsenosidimutans TaxID=2908004 RepID=A0ABS9KQE3_9BACT|nr:hypothetical protein [Terrimonas ginsenosidimutans]MCG2614533.1 hypothetical protein [Terrimonas ginsenosidimutans]
MKKQALPFLFLSFFTNALNAQNIFPTPSGNVGIGTTTPEYILDVRDASRIAGHLFLEQSGPRGILRMKPVSGTNTSRVFDFFEDADIGNSAYGLIGITNEPWGAPLPSFTILSGKNGTGGPAKDIVIWAHDNPGTTNATMTIQANTGRVGIGTTTPQAELAVNGNIFSKKVKVTQSGWPDYVFAADYKLPSLQEIEAFIKLRKHLPGIPSAEDVDKNGLDLGDNQAQLLKKIEELTLYAIEQEKDAKKRDEVIDQLTKKMEELEQKLAMIAEKIQQAPPAKK